MSFHFSLVKSQSRPLAYQVLLMVGIGITDVYIYASVVLFLCLICLVSMSIGVVVEDVRCRLSPCCDRVGWWSQSYDRIDDVVRAVDAFFGPTLLVFLARMFIFFVINVFRMTLEFGSVYGSHTLPMRVIYFAKVLSLVVVLAFRAQAMKQQVTHMPYRAYSLTLL